MCVYFIQSIDGGLIKIGYSNNPTKRLRELQLGCPIELCILGIVLDADIDKEYEYHKLFDDFRIYGEWFSPAPSFLEFIHENTTELKTERLKFRLPPKTDDYESENPLLILIKRSKITVLRIAEISGISRNTISRLCDVEGMPRKVRLETLDNIAQAVGYRVKLSFEPIGESPNG